MKLLILLFLVFSQSLFAQYEGLEGKTFNHPGPNCFGVAMYANQNIRTVRGVDLKEFSAFVPKNCEAVTDPEAGDIGTFHNGVDFIHAFIYLGNELVLEKTGVDYLGKTPVQIRNMAHTIYTFEASPECRRWGNGSRDCYSDLQYYRCTKGLGTADQAIQNLEERIEEEFKQLLEGNASVEERIVQLVEMVDEYEKQISTISNDPLLEGRLVSFRKQIKFLL